ncbi:MAG: TrkH family potassium uptake protein [Candidatus Margulisbacteria bacterium]|nr:TrkH family potassium uptake protein [Candidatus Margulisiibacteriota bacterium]MBU1871140.1 TrkH family potassium uptake protein [Patescibacteria group bacterium]
MIIKPSRDDYYSIAFFTGRTMIIFGLLFLVPLFTALLFLEWNPAIDYGVVVLFCFAAGLLLQTVFHTEKDLTWLTGLAVTSLSWLVMMFLGAIPLFMSGHYGSYLDACFDAMSGMATTGLALIQDLDHLAISHNMWRHFLMFVGGQGILVIGLTFLIRGSAGAYRMYVGEAREEKILPNVIKTARFIWGISIFYMLIGTGALALVAFLLGMPPITSLLHGLWIFMAAFDTGGFTPHSQSILYYHSFAFETVTVVLMLLGTMNFAVHYALWNRNIKELWKNLEIRSLFITTTLTLIMVGAGLAALGTYPNWTAFIRKGAYQLISAHSGTGYMTIYASQFITEWNPLAFFAIILAMAFGGSACSTAGGIKALRLGITLKAFIQDIKKIMIPGGSVIIVKFHHVKDVILNENIVRPSLLILIAYITTYVLGTIAGLFYGYSLASASFESVSACANVGLSCGITSPGMPNGLKVVYIIQMWLGRLEFMSVFALIGLIIAGFRGK